MNELTYLYSTCICACILLVSLSMSLLVSLLVSYLCPYLCLYLYFRDVYSGRRPDIVPKPQASAWGIPDKRTVASERRFMIFTDTHESIKYSVSYPANNA